MRKMGNTVCQFLAQVNPFEFVRLWRTINRCFVQGNRFEILQDMSALPEAILGEASDSETDEGNVLNQGQDSGKIVDI